MKLVGFVKRTFKRITKSSFMQRVLGRILSAYLLLVYKTTKWKVYGLDQVNSDNVPAIFVFWHGRMAMAPFTWNRKFPFFMLISGHSDGQIIAKTVAHLGIDTIYGSKSRGGAGALRAMLKMLKSRSASIGITPDGPRGPFGHVSSGIFSLSLLSQKKVYPLSFATKNCIKLSSWDRFIVPLPLGRGALVMGRPIDPPSFLSDEEKFLKEVKIGLDDAVRFAEQMAAL
ncbi:lysophospholipid acyltransferase family protein [Candidatus Hydrogenosomobacter endosymbioticus]|uniref:lysophospholipid acyltransferase family protein n=1 Tax=Candidatus Hydrogenosomobacter endosymbioticus TaxID=2558174 RepID=UPI001F44EC8F|nr:lysophospholipid acyltransferase family protein [Candidatus Hydrogenosomobacter endosymbioticus]